MCCLGESSPKLRLSLPKHAPLELIRCRIVSHHQGLHALVLPERALLRKQAMTFDFFEETDMLHAMELRGHLYHMT